MNEITIKTQKEFNELPNFFDCYTRIIIKSNNSIKLVVNKRIKNAHVVARGSSHVVAWESSHVVARGSSHVEARESSHVEAWGSSHVVAWESSHVEAWGSSHVEARGSSHVVAWESSHVVARGIVSINVKSCYSMVLLFSFSVALVSKKMYSSKRIKKKNKTAHIQITKDCGWFENNGIKKTKNVILFKKVSKDFKTQESTKNETLWEIGTIINHPTWSPEKQECGEGKFHAVSKPYFADEFRNKKNDRYIAIRIKLDDIYEWKDPYYTYKIAFRKGKVLFECDRYGKEIIK
jgi:hypothetical protein